MNGFENLMWEMAMADPESVKRALAASLWDMDGGGKDFHSAKYNHAQAEGYEKRYWEPYYPQQLEQ